MHSFDNPRVAPYWPTWPCYPRLVLLENIWQCYVVARSICYHVLKRKKKFSKLSSVQFSIGEIGKKHRQKKISKWKFWNLIADADSSWKSMNKKCSSFFDIFTRSLSNIKKLTKNAKLFFCSLFCWKNDFLKNELYFVHILSMENMNLQSDFKKFHFEIFSFKYLCQFGHSRTEPRILKFFFFLQHDSKWTLQQ